MVDREERPYNAKRLGKALSQILRCERPDAWLTAQELQSLVHRFALVEQIAEAMAADPRRFEWRLRSTNRSGWQLWEYRARARRDSGAGASSSSGTARPSSAFDTYIGHFVGQLLLLPLQPRCLCLLGQTSSGLGIQWSWHPWLIYRALKQKQI